MRDIWWSHFNSRLRDFSSAKNHFKYGRIMWKPQAVGHAVTTSWAIFRSGTNAVKITGFSPKIEIKHFFFWPDLVLQQCRCTIMLRISQVIHVWVGELPRHSKFTIVRIRSSQFIHLWRSIFAFYKQNSRVFLFPEITRMLTSVASHHSLSRVTRDCHFSTAFLLLFVVCSLFRNSFIFCHQPSHRRILHSSGKIHILQESAWIHSPIWLTFHGPHLN
jgi:hypothetical protein